jgi:ADP-ribose pyrophosphatase YjhB (NUDIX family)
MTLRAFARLCMRRSHVGGIALPRPATSSRTGSSPGGAIDLGESVAQAAVRETLEGLRAITGIPGIYPDVEYEML